MGALEASAGAGGTVGSTGLGAGRGACGECGAARGLSPTAGLSPGPAPTLPSASQGLRRGPRGGGTKGELRTPPPRPFSSHLTPSQTRLQSGLSVSKLNCAF